MSKFIELNAYNWSSPVLSFNVDCIECIADYTVYTRGYSFEVRETREEILAKIKNEDSRNY